MAALTLIFVNSTVMWEQWRACKVVFHKGQVRDEKKITRRIYKWNINREFIVFDKKIIKK